MITQQEISDALVLIEGNGLRPDDFRFDDKDVTSWQNSLSPVRSRLLIVNTANGKSKEYQANAINSWTIEFKRDLEAGYFDNGPRV